MMSSAKSKTPIKVKGSSGEHPAVQAFRQKMDSIQDTTLPLVEEVNERITKMKAKSSDPRREDDSEEIQSDVVELSELAELDELDVEPDPFPAKETP
jgi:hypothetical protein